MTAGKGEAGGVCNRPACNTTGASYFYSGYNGVWYCKPCALLTNAAAGIDLLYRRPVSVYGETDLMLVVYADGQIRYDYRATPDMGFNFSTLSEVGQPFIPSYEAIIEANGLEIVTVELPAAPWLTDALSTQTIGGATPWPPTHRKEYA